ncbi:MAG: class I SAM-dependent methyltransferase [Endomicrobiales bacterium]|nr:class I SAM-dependent methyltransferase [Endomicrobiales bacterium]
MNNNENLKILDVGPGYHKYPGAVGIDSNPLAKPDVSHDLNVYPWPLKDNEFDMVYTSHCLEHLSDPKKAVEEIWRVARPGADVIIQVPHFSSRVAWTDIEHTRAFSIHMLRGFTGKTAELAGAKVRFEVRKVILRWHQKFDMELLPGWVKVFVPALIVVNAVITFLANLNTEFCERIWCYYVGGMGEVEFHSKVIKNGKR